MPESQPAPHVRRVRYKGTHPRQFGEKYKELAPEQYVEDVQKVMLRGQTPAGMHRPICVDEIVKALRLKPGMVGLDATLGYGGHAARILQKITPGGCLHGLDVDPLELPRTEERLRAMGYGPDSLIVRRMNFAGIGKVAAEIGRSFDFVLADLGVSSMQIDNPERGFSFKVRGPLDLRLNPSRGKSAAELLANISETKLADLLDEYSDEPHAQAIAHAIHLRTQALPITTTQDLRETIAATLAFLPEAAQKDEVKKSCQRTFQALRIAVNDEFVVLEQLLEQLPFVLAPGGRVAILSFHSGEDRRVKKSFQLLARTGIYSAVAPDPIRPSVEECQSNPRSTSAKLRWAVRSDLIC